MADPNLEYIAIHVNGSSNLSVFPNSEPQAKAAVEAGRNTGSVIGAVNKLAEVGYRLIPGTGIVDTGPVSTQEGNFIVFMYREK